VFNRVLQGMGQGLDHPVWAGVAEVARQDGQLQRVLEGGVAQPAQDLPEGSACRWVRGRADQDEAADPVRIPHRQINGDLAAEGIAKHHDGWQPVCLEPVGRVVGMLGDVQDPFRVAAQPEAG